MTYSDGLVFGALKHIPGKLFPDSKEEENKRILPENSGIRRLTKPVRVDIDLEDEFEKDASNKLILPTISNNPEIECSDGSVLIAVILYGIPANISLSSGRKNPDGSWALIPQQFRELSLITPKDFKEEIKIKIKAIGKNKEGKSVVSETEITFAT